MKKKSAAGLGASKAQRVSKAQWVELAEPTSRSDPASRSESLRFLRESAGSALVYRRAAKMRRFLD